MGELHRPDSRVVGLQDGLEVERQAIPQRELAACGASQYSSCFGCPLRGLQLSNFCKVLRDELTTTQLTGHLILLVDVCTNLVHKDVEGLLGYALGGRSCTRDILSLCTPYIPNNSPLLHR